MNTRHSQLPQIFLNAVTEIIELEGGYVLNPADPGGETKFGISKRQYPNLDIRSLTYDAAVDIYWRDYWQALRFQKMLPDAFAVFLFDSAVNHGPKQAIIFMQRGLGVRGDGVIGPKTLSAASTNEIGGRLVVMLSYRADFYAFLVSKKPNQITFRRGWFKRLFRLQQFIFNNHLIED